jgi:prepilin-type N-terminal cleavage/methylation domain-containing protein
VEKAGFKGERKLRKWNRVRFNPDSGGTSQNENTIRNTQPICGISSLLNSRCALRVARFGSHGFTLIELIIVMILAGILVAAVAVRISLSPSQIASVTAVDQAVADIQYVQMRALAGRTTSSIAFTSGSANYTISGATSENKTLPGGTTAGTTVTFSFNSLGELTGGSNLTLSLGGSTITVYRITGKVTS